MPYFKSSKKKLKFYFLLLFLVSNQVSFCQENLISNDLLKGQIDSALNFMQSSQIKETIPEKQYAGEWPVDMHLTSAYFFIGKKQKAQDSNCFTVSAIHNALAEVYLLDSSRKELLPILKAAHDDIAEYDDSNLYNFWKKLPPTRRLKYFNEPKPQPLVHRPTNFHLRIKFIHNAANVPEDADDTSLGNLAAYYSNRLFDTKNSLASYKRFDEYLDLNRKNRNWFNVLFHADANSGAYMTWLHPEYEYNRWNVAKTAFNTLLIFVPGSTARPEAYEPWVPFGANDVDVVVNANVLTYLAKTHQLEKSIGYKNSAELIEKRLKKRAWANNSVYYPNQFHIHFTVAKAYASGAELLKNSAEIVLKDILEKQNEDGSFQSYSFINHFDKVQTTVNALSAMVDCKKKGLEVSDDVMKKAIKFILSQKITSGNEIHWEAGVYFSGGTLLRNTLFWKSEAYTTVAIINCFQRYLSL
ncbi:hypothetical protein EGI22_08750 [Lacihabitans sp. LS3-19]|uniref:hypothetical protein n=1 Tax=Lacihabitans sp. LS3-19 TaxID=2487335 RepID=UPI0020CE0C82|nr:hypothetical protein [Lacihabitans sp. LS3-19]MCP9768000.1 hypothetical protein [Lacihabitans sp. LS3-19]